MEVRAPDDDQVLDPAADEEVSAEETLDGEEATPEESAEQMPDAETSQPPKGYVKETDLRALQSKKDQEVAEAKREGLAVQQQLAAMQVQQVELLSRFEQTQLELLEIRTSGMTDAEAAVERGKYEIAKDKRALESERRSLAMERLATQQAQAIVGKNRAAEHYSVTYRVPKGILMEAETEPEMVRLAKVYSALKRTGAAEFRKVAGTDRMDSGAAQGTIPSDLKRLEERFANGDDTVYDALMAARKKRGIRTFGT